MSYKNFGKKLIPLLDATTRFKSKLRNLASSQKALCGENRDLISKSIIDEMINQLAQLAAGLYDGRRSMTRNIVTSDFDLIFLRNTSGIDMMQCLSNFP